jgi:hypothetical protein
MVINNNNYNIIIFNLKILIDTPEIYKKEDSPLTIAENLLRQQKNQRKLGYHIIV